MEVFEQFGRLKMLCDNIANLNDEIELVAILNHKGRVIEISPDNDNVTKEFTLQKREMFFMQCVLQSTMSKEHDYEFGEVTSSVLERKKFTIYSFDLHSYVILAVSNPVLNPLEIKNYILETITSSTKKIEQ